jgi:hypothetical protein
MNRILVYGNTAPLAPVYPAGSIIGIRPGPIAGSDGTFTSEFSQIDLLPGGAIKLEPYSGAAMVPEGSFLWENGVFNEDIFNVRFMRPISERVSFDFFSNFRHFDGTDYSHSNSSISTFYQSLHADTTQQSNLGHNPLSDEYAAGGRIRYANPSGGAWSLGLNYTDCSNELALDGVASDGTQLWAQLHQFRSSLDFMSSGNSIGPASLAYGARLESDGLSNMVPQSTGDSTANLSGKNVEIAGALNASLPVRDSAAASLHYGITHVDRTAYDLQEHRSLAQSPELSIAIPVHAGLMNIVGAAGAGYSILILDNQYAYASTWSLSLDGREQGNELRVFARESALPYDIPYDSALRPINPTLLNRYHAEGAELSLQGRTAGLVVGAQLIQGVDSETVVRAWPMGMPPYSQPAMVFLATPSVKPWHWMRLASRTLLSDRRPFVKNQTSLSFITHPEETREYIESRVSLDYWSPRDTIDYAGITTWNREIYDLNLEIATHVRTFRFFAKVDNLLNRKFAYVPGYYSPGLTFRWGIDWYLQR